MLCLCLFPTGCFAVMMSFTPRGISLQRQAVLAVLLCSPAMWPSCSPCGDCCSPLLIEESAVLPNCLRWWHLGHIERRGEYLLDAGRNPRSSQHWMLRELHSVLGGVAGCEQSGVTGTGWSAGLSLGSLLLVHTSSLQQICVSARNLLLLSAPGFAQLLPPFASHRVTLLS